MDLHERGNVKIMMRIYNSISPRISGLTYSGLFGNAEGNGWMSRRRILYSYRTHGSE